MFSIFGVAWAEADRRIHRRWRNENMVIRNVSLMVFPRRDHGGAVPGIHRSVGMFPVGAQEEDSGGKDTGDKSERTRFPSLSEEYRGQIPRRDLG